MYDYQQILEEINNTKIRSAYLMFGEENQLADDLIAKIKKKFLLKSEPEINFFVRFVSDQGVDEIISLGSGMSLFSEKKVILLKEAELIKQTDLERLSKFLSKNLEGICIIFHTVLSNLNQSRLKSLDEKLTLINLSPLGIDELKNFIVNEFDKFGKEVTMNAVDSLIFLVGNHLSDLTGQINIICQFYMDNKIIDVSEVENIASTYATHDVFKLNRYIATRDYGKASFTLLHLLESGISPQQIISQLLRHYFILWKLLGLSRYKMSDSALLAKELKIYRKYLEEYKIQSQIWNLSSINRVLKLIYEADKTLKSSTVAPQIVLDLLSHEIINLI